MSWYLLVAVYGGGVVVFAALVDITDAGDPELAIVWPLFVCLMPFLLAVRCGRWVAKKYRVQQHRRARR